jgi:hypothetical protein
VNRTILLNHVIAIEPRYYGWGIRPSYIAKCQCGWKVMRNDQGEAESAGLTHLELQRANAESEYVGKH